MKVTFHRNHKVQASFKDFMDFEANTIFKVRKWHKACQAIFCAIESFLVCASSLDANIEQFQRQGYICPRRGPH